MKAILKFVVLAGLVMSAASRCYAAGNIAGNAPEQPAEGPGQTDDVFKRAVSRLLSPGAVGQGGNGDQPAVVVSPVVADDLDILVSKESTADQRGTAYERLMKADFDLIAPKLMALRGTHAIFSGIGPRTNEPWKEELLTPEDRIGCTLEQLWSKHPRNGKGGHGAELSVLLRLLNDPPVGNSRTLALGELKANLHFGVACADKSLPPMGAVLEKLDAMVRDQSSPKHVRRQVLEILFEHGDPNNYLDLAIALSDEGSTLRQAEDFRFCTPIYQASRFTAENRARFLRHCYGLLEKIDDGSGAGYFLAIHIGNFLGIKPGPHANGAFMPDPRLAHYQGATGLKTSYFQETVDNAKQWWKDHQTEYP